jgi:hypothetical protein
MIQHIKNFICALFKIKQCACPDEVGQKGLPIINEVNRKLEKINRKHSKESE